MNKHLFRGLLVGFALFLVPLAVVATPTIRETWTATNQYLAKQKQEKAMRDHAKRLKYIQSLPPGAWPAVHPNVRDLPD